MSEAAAASLYVDQTHVGRHVTGVERMALELFSPETLAPHRVVRVTARGLPRMIAAQQVAFLARGLRDPSAMFMFPGFPPSPLSCLLGDRCLMFVHDTFPLSRPEDVGVKARAYTAPSFRFALQRLRRLFVNSVTTGKDLRRYCRADATVALLRPGVRDVFGLAGTEHPTRLEGAPLRLLAIGTIEPRKNYAAAIEVVRALNAMGTLAELHIVGRLGWGKHSWLARPPGFVRWHGYVDDDRLKGIVRQSDLFLSTSHAEGLGLPQLEVQHGGLPVVVPKAEVFKEVLGESAVLIDPTAPADAASQIRAFVFDAGRLAQARDAACRNIIRWNALARKDGERFQQFLSQGADVYAAASHATVM